MNGDVVGYFGQLQPLMQHLNDIVDLFFFCSVLSVCAYKNNIATGSLDRTIKYVQIDYMIYIYGSLLLNSFTSYKVPRLL